MVTNFFKPMLFKFFLVCLIFKLALSAQVHTIGIGFTRDTALKNALKIALEKKIKAYISDNAYMQNAQIISRKFTGDVCRYILDTNVISEKEYFNCFQIQAAVDIDNLKLKEHLKAHDFEVKSISKPSIVMLIDEYNNNIKMSEKTAGFTLKQILVKNGYTILDLKQETEIFSGSSFSDTVHFTDVAHLGFKNSVDLVIRGLVNAGKATPVDVYGNKQLTVPVHMNIEVIRTDNAQIIASNTLSMRKNAATEFSALQFVLKSAAKETGKNILAKLDAFCESEDYTERHFEFIIDGLSYAQADKLESDIVKITCVKNVVLRYLEKQRAVYWISIKGSLTELRKEISSGKIPGLSIESLTGGKIVGIYGKDSLQTVSQPVHSDVEITSFSIEELYPSKSRYYVKHPAGKLILSSTVQVYDFQLSLSLPEILSEPFQITRNHLDTGENKIDLYIVPAYEKLINIMQTRTFQGQLVLQYSIAGKVHSRSLTIPVTVYGINGMSWDYPETISSFITNDDPVVRSFARRTLQEMSYGSEINQDLVNAIAVHAAIRNYGIQYVKDPSPASGKAIDMVQYPTQTLFHRTGDCDDLSVLYCSLLSSLGIQVSLISYDDHVFFIINTGIYEKNRLALSSDTTVTILHDKKLWIPIEATDMHSSFVENWHSTAKKFHDAMKAGREFRIIDIQEAWKRYPPVSLFKEKLKIGLKSVKNEVEKQLMNLQDVTTRQYLQEIARLKSIKKKDAGDPAALKNRIGLLYVRSGNYQKAIKFFKHAYHIKKSQEMQSNYAGALLLSGEGKEALKIFDKIYKKDNNGKIAVNRALCKYIISEDTSDIQDFYEYLYEAIFVVQSDGKLSEILGFDISGLDSLRGSKKLQTNDISELDIGILRQYLKAVTDLIKQKKLSVITTESSTDSRITGTTTETSTGTTADNITKDLSPFGGLRGAANITIRKLIDLLYWFDL